MEHVSQYPAARVAIIGAGFVGSTTAYALMMTGAASEIALIDAKKERAEGEALDLMHCMQFTTSVRIEAGDDFSLVKNAAVVVIAAGVPQKPGQSRSELLETNTLIFKDIVPKIMRYNSECIILVVTNPLDVLTYVTLKISGFPSCRVLGSGTVLDTARLRYLMGQHFKVSPKDITAYILGEHGESEFAWWSSGL
jgi:L-lactate dehydrogenase